MAESLRREDVAQMVVAQLAEILEVSPENIAPNATFADLGADSLALIELVEAIEEQLSSHVEGFHIDDEDLEGLSSVDQAVDYVANKLQVP